MHSYRECDEKLERKGSRGRRKGRYGNHYTHGENARVNLMAQTTTWRWVMGAVAFVAIPVAMPVLMAGRLWAGQTAAPQTATPPQASAAVANAGPELGTVLGRLIPLRNVCG